MHYCSQQRGYPAKPLLEYTVEDIRREYLTAKSCAPRCTVACVHQISYIDFWRDPQDLISLGQPAGESWRPGAASVICVSVSPNVPQLYRVRDLPSGTEVHN